MTTPYYTDDQVTVHAGDCLDVLAELPDASVDSVVTDPPYGLEFMGKEWDAPWKNDCENLWATRDKSEDLTGKTSSPFLAAQVNKYRAGLPFQQWCTEWATECLRVLKPGGHLLAFGGTRTWHRLACAVEDAGFEIRDNIAWLYGSGFPKSLDVSKAIDKAAGAERETVRHDARPATSGTMSGKMDSRPWIKRSRELGYHEVAGPDAVTVTAKQWQGWGTALKPAFEPVVVARKPIRGTVAANVVEHGTGALNIDACRVAHDEPAKVATRTAPRYSGATTNGGKRGGEQSDIASADPAGRWPANVVIDEDTAQAIDKDSGVSVSRRAELTSTPGGIYGAGKGLPSHTGVYGHDDGASRYFPTFKYEAKAPTSERPSYYRQTCECEDSWPTTSRQRGTAATTAANLSTSKSGNDTTADQSPTATKSTTSTSTNSTTTPTTSSQSPQPNTNDFTPVANSEMASGSNPASCVDNSNQSTPHTGISAEKAGHSMADADHATSPKWSERSRCGNCGAPARREAHATVKPLDLMRWLVRLVTPPGGLILDPFAGSGTTAEAAIHEHMRAIVIEREPDYLPLIVARLSKPLAVGFDFGSAS